jgi:hypothetical protein
MNPVGKTTPRRRNAVPGFSSQYCQKITEVSTLSVAQEKKVPLPNTNKPKEDLRIY